MNSVTTESCKLLTPFTAIIAGSSMSGKTYYLRKLINERNTLLKPKVNRVIYSYNRYQSFFDTFKDVEFVKGTTYKLDRNIPTLLIIDDQADTIDPKELVELFTVTAHHENTSVIFVTQNLFMQNKAFRTAALNAQYLFLFKSPRMASQIAHLSKQIHPGHTREILELYNDATSTPYSYLLIDLKPQTPEVLRYRTNILNDEGLEIETEDGKKVRLTHCYVV